MVSPHESTPVWIALDRLDRGQHTLAASLDDFRREVHDDLRALRKAASSTTDRLERWETSWPPIIRAAIVITLALAAGVKADALFAVAKTALGL